MTNKLTDVSHNNEDKMPPAAGLVLELEYMLFPGRQLTYKAFNAVLIDHQVKLNQAVFSRYCLHRSIEKSLQNLLSALEKKGITAETIAVKIKKHFASSLHHFSCQPVPGIMALLKKAEEKNIRIGLLSFLPEENARQLMARVPLSQSAHLHVMKKEATDLPTSDSWLSLLKAMKMTPRCAIALVDGATACKSALAVGMCSVVVPDCFTAMQEFTGADIVVENADDLKLNKISALLSMAHFRKRAK